MNKRDKRLKQCLEDSFQQSPFCRTCGVSIDKSWRCRACTQAESPHIIEEAHALMVRGLKAAYHLARVCDTVPYNGYGHRAWDDYFAIQKWLDQHAPTKNK